MQRTVLMSGECNCSGKPSFSCQILRDGALTTWQGAFQVDRLRLISRPLAICHLDQWIFRTFYALESTEGWGAGGLAGVGTSFTSSGVGLSGGDDNS